MKHKGFSIIELVIYLGIFSIFSLLVFSFFIRFYKNAYLEFKQNKRYIRKIAIIDLIKRDLQAAAAKVKYWDEQNLVFKKCNIKKNYKDISWQFRSDGVYRLLGIYDFSRKKWHKKNVSKIDFDFFKFKYVINKSKNKVKNIKILFDNKEFVINLCNKYKYEQ